MRTPALLRCLPLLLAGFLAACAGVPDPAERGFQGSWLVDGALQAPAATPRVQAPAARPTVALVLGGGGLRGFAHIGVLQALEEAGIRPDLVVGTSIGAIVGAAYASGRSPAQIWQQADSLRVRSLADIALSGPGFVKGEALARWADGLVGGQAIEQFPVRFVAVATDVDRGRPYVITQGDAGQALRASAAIPGVFLPVQADGLTLVDGGVAGLVPVRAARALGADVVIAVDIYCHGPRYPSNSSVSMWLRVSQVQSCLLSGPEAASADVLIAPAIAPAGVNDAPGRETARRLGYEAATAQLPALLSVLRQRGMGVRAASATPSAPP
ncbi:patatin-like phospholipase family protein [Paracidovorax konjaci]|uniref:NTE family protein n=1 Tax=Paracidovorax konjaci TaxID=32040 RepID=A0A1I1TIH1_9BURK|nr:patatin-like phospholipase family protein [Paracidovorax konjaci]SFD58416.1 NTE family protein [Paracidovorax konjaci]